MNKKHCEGALRGGHVNKLDDVRQKITLYALEIERFFVAEPKVTILVRNPTVQDGDLLITNDDLTSIETSLNRLKTKDKK